MAYSSIAKPTDYFNTVLYTGDGTSNRNITGFGFQPDWLWQKTTNQTFNHYWFDSARGNSSVLKSNSTDAQDTSTTGFNGFISDGFNVSQVTGWEMNNSSLSVQYANWCWRAGGSASSNSNGSITSSVSANTTSGFSIVSYTGTGSVATVGHGLGAAPKLIIVKTRSLSGEAWPVDSRAASGILYLNETSAEGSYGDSSPFPSTAPTTTVFSIGTPNNTNGSGATYIAYCFAEVKGYSKIGSYTGNGNADGTFVYTGFKPAWVMVRETSNVNSWRILDNKRDTFNVMTQSLYANLNNAEGSSGHNTDFISNGFKIRDSDTSMNRSSGSFIFMAFAENPFVANDSGTAVPVVAR